MTARGPSAILSRCFRRDLKYIPSVGRWYASAVKFLKSRTAKAPWISGSNPTTIDIDGAPKDRPGRAVFVDCQLHSQAQDYIGDIATHENFHTSDNGQRLPACWTEVDHHTPNKHRGDSNQPIFLVLIAAYCGYASAPSPWQHQTSVLSRRGLSLFVLPKAKRDNEPVLARDAYL